MDDYSGESLDTVQLVCSFNTIIIRCFYLVDLLYLNGMSQTI